MAKMISTAAATVAVFASFAAVPASAEDKCARVVTTDWNAELLNADPARLVTLSDVYHARMIFEPLIDADDAMQPVPVLAESWGDIIQRDFPGRLPCSRPRHAPRRPIRTCGRRVSAATHGNNGEDPCCTSLPPRS
jgi:ABC-type transport system substrate-binding protein